MKSNVFFSDEQRIEAVRRLGSYPPDTKAIAALVNIGRDTSNSSELRLEATRGLGR